jgi:5'-nucleotidase
MNILLTNDDGIEGAGFLDFAEALRSGTAHHIYVLAPDANCSGVSSHLTISAENLELRPHKKGGADTWSCPGTPCDCVRLGIMEAFSVKIDAVISGINSGSNIGTDIIYSGTAAAARQGALCGVPSIAYSLVSSSKPFLWKSAIDYAVSVLEELLGLWKRDIFLNVNIPNTGEAPKGYRITYPAIRNYEDSLTVSKGENGVLLCSLGLGEETTEDAEGTDYRAVIDGYASVSPVFIHPVILRDLFPGVPAHAGAGGRPEPAGIRGD